jgi:hypothetical protein
MIMETTTMKTLNALKIAVVAGLLLVLAFAAVPGAGAQQGIVWSTGIQVQNLGTGTANITLTFYNSAGGAPAGSTNDTIAAGGSKTYFPVPVVAAGFNGSAVISSDQPVAAIMNLLGNGGAYAGSATGLTAGSTSVSLPLIMRANSGFDTWLNVQNAGNVDTTVTISYKPGSIGSPTTETALIKAGAAHTFDQQTNVALGAKFIGSATVTTNNSQPIVAVVNQVGKTSSKTLLTYDGFGPGSTTVTLPLVMANNAGFFTGIGVQNVGNASTTVTIDYGPNTAGTLNPANETVTLAAGASFASIQAGAAWPSRYVGSAKITSTGQPLVAVLNQLGGTSVAVGTAYEGFNPSTLTNKVSAPLLMSNNGGYITAMQIANPGATAVTINVAYSPNSAGGFQPTNISGLAIPAGSSVTIFQTGNSNGTNWGANKYVGGATITATGGNIAAIVNELNLAPTGDQFLTYDGINF